MKITLRWLGRKGWEVHPRDMIIRPRVVVAVLLVMVPVLVFLLSCLAASAVYRYGLAGHINWPVDGIVLATILLGWIPVVMGLHLAGQHLTYPNRTSRLVLVR